MLCAQGICDIHARGCDNRTALALAASRNMHSVVKRLLEMYYSEGTGAACAIASADSCAAAPLTVVGLKREAAKEVREKGVSMQTFFVQKHMSILVFECALFQFVLMLKDVGASNVQNLLKLL